MNLESDNPTIPGIYAVRQWYAWRILEWDGKKWWHVGKQCEWPKNAAIDACVGPLPVVSKDFSAKAKEILEDWERIIQPNELLSDLPMKEYDL